MRRRSVFALVCVAIAALLFITISVVAQFMTRDTLGPVGPIDKSKLQKPKTFGAQLCCVGDGAGFCATAFHGEVNGVRYYAVASQKGNFPANVATWQKLTPHPRKPDADFCECTEYEYVPLEQLLKIGTTDDQMVASRKLQQHGLPRYITATEKFQCGEGTRLLQEEIVRADNQRCFRLFRIETYPEPEPGGKSATKIQTRFGQELDPQAKLQANAKATLVETVGCFAEIKVGEDIFFVLTRGAEGNEK